MDSVRPVCCVCVCAYICVCGRYKDRLIGSMLDRVRGLLRMGLGLGLGLGL